MVNFRYHLVSLIAVFLALGVGVVLGAGPLQNAINAKGDPDSADSLDAVKEQLIQADQQVIQGEEFVWAVAEEVLPETLTDIDVAVVLLPGSAALGADPVVRALEEAGAKVVGEVELTSRWDDPDSSTYRQTLATAASSHLKERPAHADSESILAQGLIEVLTQSSTETDLLAEMLTDEKTALVVPGTLPSNVAEAVVLVGPSVVAESIDEDDSTVVDTQVSTPTQSGDQVSSSEEVPTTSAWSALATAAAGAPKGSVAVGSAAEPGDFIAVLRDGDTSIATVYEGGTARAALNVALVLSSGADGAYGQELGASTPVAPLP